ncbi:MAG: hypothetical protein J7L95_03135 [Prolixibacteraceae bacterium]|nr:hypothetical protein [Prolixibacteraceae bacterium]
MTEEDRLLLNELKVNVEKLFQEFFNLEEEKRTLEASVLNLKNDIKKLEQEKIEFSRKNEQMRIATHLLSGVDENREAKQKINKLVREIDKCIALLNK